MGPARISFRAARAATVNRWLIPFLALMLASAPGSEARADLILDLADIVGGGDGTGTGGDQGISMTTGTALSSHTASSFSPGNAYVPSANDFVDGVFTPDGGAGAIQVSSTGITVTGVSDSNAQTWDHIWNGLNAHTNTALTFDSIIGSHASKGITFDLDAMEAANPGMVASSYNLTAANANHTDANIDYYVFVDGNLDHSINLDGREITHGFGPTSLSSSARFLTLIASSNGNHFGDWSNWINPSVTLQAVPEPSSGLLLIVGLGGLAFVRRR